MKNGIDGDAILARLVENLEWETPDKSPSKLIHGSGEKMWMTLNRENAGLDAAQKLLAESRLAFLVPAVGLLNIILGFRRIDYLINHSAPVPRP